MRTLTLASRKGGSGKSSLAVSIACVAAADGERVAMLDLDPQGSAVTWGRRRQDPALVGIRVQAVEPAGFRAAMAALEAEGFSLAVVDTPGVLSPAVSPALTAGFVVVPVRTSVVDVDGAEATATQLKVLKARYGFVLNSVNPSTPGRSIDTAEALAVIGPLAPIVVSNRVDFADAMISGMGVTELNARGKAADEIRAAWAWVREQIGAER